MHNTGIAQKAHEFLTEFKATVLHQVELLNRLNNGELQDGFNPMCIEDGWVSLKGFSWGFVMLYDEPVRIDMIFGPDWPFIGYRHTFVAEQGPNGICWVNQKRPAERYFNAHDLARDGLRRLARKVGDSWIFDTPEEQPLTGPPDLYYADRSRLV